MINTVVDARTSTKGSKEVLPEHIIRRGTNGILYAKFTVDKKGYLLSTRQSENVRLAVQKKNFWRKAAIEKRFDDIESTQARPGIATIAQILEVYERVAPDFNVLARTVRQNSNALKHVISRGAGIDRERAGDFCCSGLTRGLKDAYSADAQKKSKTTNKLLRDRSLRTIRSTLIQARTIFSRKFLEQYEDAGLNVPSSIGEFVNSFVGVNAPLKYSYPHDLAEPTIAAGYALKDENPALYVAFLLSYEVALRRSESVAAKKDWLVHVRERDGAMVWKVRVGTTDEFRPKASGSNREIPITDEVYADLSALWSADDEYILPGVFKTNRMNLIKEDLSSWLRKLGWDMKRFPKAGHELRKLQGSHWYTRRSPQDAQKWLGHKSIVTTCQFYGDVCDTARPLPRSAAA